LTQAPERRKIVPSRKRNAPRIAKSGLCILKKEQKSASRQENRGPMMHYWSAVLTFLLVAPSNSAIVNIPYEEWASGLQAQLDQVSEAKGLSFSDARLAERIVGHWIYVGPCRGSADKLANKKVNVIGMTLRPKVPSEAAMLEMIALINLQDLERGSSDFMCRFALSKANSGP
jgi:hypothetical protein